MGPEDADLDSKGKRRISKLCKDEVFNSEHKSWA